MYIIRVLQTKVLGVALVLIVALSAAVRIQSLRLERQQHRTTEVALQASNAVAERDSTRNVALENKTVATLLGDSLRLVAKQVVQAAQKSDALDRAMNRQRVASYALSAAVDSLHAVILSPSTSLRVDSAKDPGQAHDHQSPDVRQASFQLRKEPFTVDAQVQIPPPPLAASMDVAISADPIELEARVICAPPDGNGIRRATLATKSPSWARVRFGRIEQDPGVCTEAAPRPPMRQRWQLTLRPMIGLGVAFDRNGRVLGGVVVGWALARKN